MKSIKLLSIAVSLLGVTTAAQAQQYPAGMTPPDPASITVPDANCGEPPDTHKLIDPTEMMMRRAKKQFDTYKDCVHTYIDAGVANNKAYTDIAAKYFDKAQAVTEKFNAFVKEYNAQHSE